MREQERKKKEQEREKSSYSFLPSLTSFFLFHQHVRLEGTSRLFKLDLFS